MSYLIYLNKLLSESKISDLLVPMSKEEQEGLLSFKIITMLNVIYKYLESEGWKIDPLCHKDEFPIYVEYQKDKHLISFTTQNKCNKLQLLIRRYKESGTAWISINEPDIFLGVLSSDYYINKAKELILDKLKSVLNEGKIGDLLVPMSKEEQKERFGNTIQYKVDVMLDDIFEYLKSKGYRKVTWSIGNKFIDKDNKYGLTFFNHKSSIRNICRVMVDLWKYSKKDGYKGTVIDKFVDTDESMKEVKDNIINYLKNQLNKDLKASWRN